MNAEGIPGPRGGKWNSSTLWDLLKNAAYVGDIEFNKTTKSRYCCIRDGQPALHAKKTGKIKFQDNPKEDWIVIPDAHEPLISREQFERVQVAIGERSHNPIKSGRGKNRAYPLSGILRCGHCGEPMQGMCPDGKYRRYICSTRRKNGKSQCVPCSVTADKIEALVLEGVHEHLASDCAKEHLRHGLEEIYEGQRRSLGDVDALQRELEQLQKRKNDVFTQLMAAGALDMFKPQIDGMREEEERLKRRLATAKAELGEKLDKAGFVGQCLELYEHHVLRLKGAARTRSARAFGRWGRGWCTTR